MKTENKLKTLVYHLNSNFHELFHGRAECIMNYNYPFESHMKHSNCDHNVLDPAYHQIHVNKLNLKFLKCHYFV